MIGCIRIMKIKNSDHKVWLSPRKLPPLHFCKYLIQREAPLHCFTLNKLKRLFYLAITPNFTVANINKEPGFLRKFTPNGKYLIAFSANQTCIEIYKYNGPAAAAEILKNVKEDGLLNSEHAEYDSIHKTIFSCFFTSKHTVLVASGMEQLNRECSLFTDDGRHIIVGSTTRTSRDETTCYRTYESCTPHPRYPLDDYSLHIVDIENAVLIDSVTFKQDKIALSHNQGVYLYRDTLAVLSVQHQSIYIFRVQVTSAGAFHLLRVIGPLCYEDDEYFLSCMRQKFYPNSTVDDRNVIHSLKHRLLAYLYLQALNNEENHMQAIRDFYVSFDKYFYLKIWKMQLLDETHLLIKYAPEDVITLRTTEATAQPLFIIYDINTTEIIALYDNTSAELLELFENYADYFRNARLSCEAQQTCSLSNSYWARRIHERQKNATISSKGGGLTEAIKRTLTQLPIFAQSFSASPYLDVGLFSYDDKLVSVMERPKNCADQPIRFFGRECGLLKFCMHACRVGQPNTVSPSRPLVAFTFHPTDPFAISVQKTNNDYYVNFHLRHRPPT